MFCKVTILKFKIHVQYKNTLYFGARILQNIFKIYFAFAYCISMRTRDFAFEAPLLFPERILISLLMLSDLRLVFLLAHAQIFQFARWREHFAVNGSGVLFVKKFYFNNLYEIYF